ncbi:MAG: keratin [Leptospirales bacterium]|nr:keratin [Leptospirales bacterium]
MPRDFWRLSATIALLTLFFWQSALAAEGESGYFDWTDIFLPASSSGDQQLRRRLERLEGEIESLRSLERQLQQERELNVRQRSELNQTRQALTTLEREVQILRRSNGRAPAGAGAPSSGGSLNITPAPQSGTTDAEAIRWNALYPGMGHIRRDYEWRGWGYAIGFGLSSALTLWSYSQEQSLRSQASTLDLSYFDHQAQYQSARLRTQRFLLLSAGIYAISLADAVWTFSAPVAFDEQGAPVLRLQLSARF